MKLLFFNLMLLSFVAMLLHLASSGGRRGQQAGRGRNSFPSSRGGFRGGGGRGGGTFRGGGRGGSGHGSPYENDRYRQQSNSTGDQPYKTWQQQVNEYRVGADFNYTMPLRAEGFAEWDPVFNSGESVGHLIAQEIAQISLQLAYGVDTGAIEEENTNVDNFDQLFAQSSMSYSGCTMPPPNDQAGPSNK